MNDRGPAMTEPQEGDAGVGIPPPGYRLPTATRLGAVRLQVGDLDRSMEFYQRVLGLAPAAGDATAGTVTLRAADGTPLVELHEQRGAQPVPRNGRPGLYHYALLLPDRGRLGSLLAHFADLGLRVGMADHDVSEALYLHDPDGHGIEVYADRPRADWRHNGREIYMTTASLDVNGVIAASTGEWGVMPAGTTMGHVHLHVGSLEAASDFYHRGLGLDRVVWSYPGALFLSAGGYHHHLGTNVWAAGAPPAEPDDARLMEWRMILPGREDVAAAAASMEAAGFEIERDGDSWTAADASGTRLRVLAGNQEKG